MPCHHIRTPCGVMIICTRGRRRKCKCGKVASKLCDFPLRGRKEGKTCDAAICTSCAVEVANNGHDTVDYCRAYAELVAREQHEAALDKAAKTVREHLAQKGKP